MKSARFHVTVITQINKSVVYFIVRRNVVPNANPCSNFDARFHVSKLIKSMTNANHELTKTYTNLVLMLFYSDFTC